MTSIRQVFKFPWTYVRLKEAIDQCAKWETKVQTRYALGRARARWRDQRSGLVTWQVSFVLPDRTPTMPLQKMEMKVTKAVVDVVVI